MRSQPRPIRSSAPGAKFSTSTSQLLTSASSTFLPFGFLESRVMDRLLLLSMVKYRLSTPGISRSCVRVMSPTPGRSTLITSAPNQASSWVQVGPDCTWVKSRMRTPSSALPAWPNGLVEGFGRPFVTAFFAACFFAFRFTTFFEADFDFALDFTFDFLLFVAIVIPPLFLAKHALRVEVADAAALAAGCRIDHRVDQGRLAAVHGLVHG